jgi:hypothetical protein
MTMYDRSLVAIDVAPDSPDDALQRTDELRADIIVLGYQHHRESTVAERVIRRHPKCSVLLANHRSRRKQIIRSTRSPAPQPDNNSQQDCHQPRTPLDGDWLT